MRCRGSGRIRHVRPEGNSRKGRRMADRNAHRVFLLRLLAQLRSPEAGISHPSCRSRVHPPGGQIVECCSTKGILEGRAPVHLRHLPRRAPFQGLALRYRRGPSGNSRVSPRRLPSLNIDVELCDNDRLYHLRKRGKQHQDRPESQRDHPPLHIRIRKRSDQGGHCD